jgi:uncharacterized membrane protein YcaP (DUF421 family)
MTILLHSALPPFLQHSFDISSKDMFQLSLPVLEKLVRPIIVYLVLVVLLRIFGKRELAQLNPFDLVVLLSLSNTVQNAIIGDDNSITGGVIGAFSLLAINWLVARTLFRSPNLTRLIEGRSTVLVSDGKIDRRAMERESLSDDDLLSVLHKQGFTHLHDVSHVELEPSGTFFVEGREPDAYERQHNEIMAKLESLTQELAALRGAKS